MATKTKTKTAPALEPAPATSAGLTFEGALHALGQGKAVARMAWAPRPFYLRARLDPAGKVVSLAHFGQHSQIEHWGPTEREVLADDWIVVAE
jgi:Protein of unknown function (DUF2829)